MVGPYGLRGDREWQVQGPDGQMMNQRKFPGLARVRPFLIRSGFCLEHDEMPALEVRRPDVVTGDGKTLFGLVPVADAGDRGRWHGSKRPHRLQCRLTAIAAGYHRRVVLGEDLLGQEVSFADAAPVLVVARPRFVSSSSEGQPFGIDGSAPTWSSTGSTVGRGHLATVSIGPAEVELVMPWPR